MNRNCLPFLAARDFLLAHRSDYETAVRDFRWPQLDEFNWALDYFDAMAAGNQAPALWIVEEDGSEQRYSFAELAERSNRVANHLRERGVRRGERILLMLGNHIALWETMLAAFKLGAVVIPATALLTADDLRDRLERGGVRHLVVGSEHTGKFANLAEGCTRICVVQRSRAGRPHQRRRLSRRVPGRWPDPRQRSAAAVLHLRYHQQTEDGAAQPPELPGRPPVDPVLDRPQARRPAPEHLLPRLGQARLELLLRPVERRRLRVHPQLRAVQITDCP